MNQSPINFVSVRSWRNIAIRLIGREKAKQKRRVALTPGFNSWAEVQSLSHVPRRRSNTESFSSRLIRCVRIDSSRVDPKANSAKAIEKTAAILYEGGRKRPCKNPAENIFQTNCYVFLEQSAEVRRIQGGIGITRLSPQQSVRGVTSGLGCGVLVERSATTVRKNH